MTSGSIKTDSFGTNDVFTGNVWEDVASTTSFQITRNTTNVDVTVTSVSVKEVIPTWFPTDSSGDPIHTSTPLRTRKGTVSVYDESFKGPLIQPPRTNLFQNSTAPVTQDVATTAQAYTITVLGAGSVTVSGTATGTAVQGSPLTVTASAGIMTCTVTGTLSRVNVEAGAFGTTFIDTAATTVTRPADNLTRPTAGTALESGNNFAVYGRVVPLAATNVGPVQVIFGSQVDTGNRLRFSIVATSDTSWYFTKRISSSNIIAWTNPGAIKAETVVEYLCYCHSVSGMGLSLRTWNGSVWSAWRAWATNSDTQNAPIASTYQIGAQNNADHFAGNFPFTKIIALNPALNPQTQIADWLAKGRI